MVKEKKGGGAAPAEKNNDAKNEDWKDICKDCEIRKKGGDCYYGCEIIKAALGRKGT